MNIIDRYALSITKSIRRNYGEAGSEEALHYSLILAINTACAILIALLFGVLTGHFQQTLIVIVVLVMIKYVSGGVHLKSSLACCLTSACTFILLAHIDFSYGYAGFILDALSIFLFIRFSPRGLKNMSSIDEKHYPKLKVISVVIVFSNFFIQSPLLSAVFITQALFLTDTIYRFVDYIEGRKYS